jgi:transcriptional regulator with GAF, ATPase, and Fis domain
MPENQLATTEIVDALKQTTTEAKQLEAIFGKLLQVLTQNGFQISVDIVGVIQNMYNRLEKAEKQTQGVGRQLEQLEELLRTFTLITSSLELDHVLEDVMDTVIRLTGAERAYLMLSDKDTGDLDLSVARNWDKENIADSEAVFSRSIVNQALKEGQAILATNAQADDRFQNVKSIVNNNLRSILCIPLTLQGRVIGALYADNRITQDVFRREQIPLLTAFGTQAAIAIENARQFGAVKNDLNKALTELKSLQIELDRGHVEKQVSEITESDYFQRLSVSARSMRQRGEKAEAEDSSAES